MTVESNVEAHCIEGRGLLTSVCFEVVHAHPTLVSNVGCRAKGLAHGEQMLPQRATAWPLCAF